MPLTRLVRAAPAVIAASLLLAWAGSAVAAGEPRQRSADRAVDTIAAAPSPAVASITGRSSFSMQHGGSDLHLPPTRQNIELVSKLQVNTPPTYRVNPDTMAPDPSQPPVVPGQIADLAVYKNYAYLNSWDEPSCKRGGTFVVDISNPAAPQQTGFIPALPNSYHGEGAHVITLDTPSFRGDVLAVNNEPYSASACNLDGSRHGGFDLYDVTNPRDPQPLAQGKGDTGADDGTLSGTSETPNSSHSTFMWQGNDRRAYVVFVDNVEFFDVDIFEITNPRAPQPVAEFDFVSLAADQGHDIIDAGGLQGPGEVFLHDMVVKKIGDRFIMKADYWDAGYTVWDVTNPAAPLYIGDSHYDEPDRLTGWAPQEGNGHQGEFSFDNKYILAADEDFAPFRPVFEISTGPGAGEYDAGPVGGGASPEFLPDQRLNGPTVYGGYGCDASDPIPPRSTTLPAMLPVGEEAIIVLQRGPSGDPDNPEEACFPGEKAANGIAAGYDAVVLANHHAGELPNGAYCGSGDFPATPPIVTICTTHEALHRMFGGPTDTPVPYPPGHGPAVGAVGPNVASTASFDGWGYARLIENTPGKMREIDAHAVEESLNPNYSVGYGDLSIHEFATDPTEYVAYSAYYAAGMRVFTFGPAGLTEQGKFIDEGGNNFWGVEQFNLGNQRYFAGSDRDYGLYIFRYTGPGAPQRPTCSDSMAMVPFKSSGPVALPCSDANGNPLTRAIVTPPTAGTLSGNLNSGSATYTHTGSRIGVDRFTFKANDGSLESEPATARIVTVPRRGGRCFNVFAGTARNETLTGSRYGDRIRGRGGRDRIRGRGGDDCLSGDAGADRLSGDDGGDRLRGGKGTDRMNGGPGRDRLFGDAGADRLNAGSGKRNLLSGGGGNDRLDAVNRKRDTVQCGGGRDRVKADRDDRVADNCEAVRRTRR